MRLDLLSSVARLRPAGIRKPTEFIESAPPHLRALVEQALRGKFRLDVKLPGGHFVAWAPPIDRGCLVVVADDPIEPMRPRGPKGYPGLGGMLARCDLISLMTGDPMATVYRRVAYEAGRHKICAIIEASDKYADIWQQRVDEVSV